MNVRNLLFICTIGIVWLLGIYYYSPQRITHVETPLQENPAFDTINNEPVITLPDQSISHSSDTEKPAIPLVSRQSYTHKEEQLHQPLKTKELKPTFQKKAAVKDESPHALIQFDHAVAPLPAPVSLKPMQQPQRMVMIQSGLIKRDIGYYKLFSWHYPYLFELTINGTPLFAKKSKKVGPLEPFTIPADKPFAVRYSYQWHTPWGKRIGAKNVTFKPNPDAQQLLVYFKSNWKDEERITIEGATKISEELLEEGSN